MGDARCFELKEDVGEELLDEAIENALEALDAGDLILVPTETVYGIGGRIDRAAVLPRLLQLKGLTDTRPFTLHTGSAETAFRFGAASVAAGRLARAYWPGPLTLVLPSVEGVDLPIPPTEDGSLGFRVVQHRFTTKLLQRCPVPLYLSSANRSSDPAPSKLEDVDAAVASEAAVIWNGGSCEFGKASTVVRLGVGPAGAASKIELLREGAITTAQIYARAATLTLFLCSGNTCRSPMAEALCRAHYAALLHCDVEALPEHGLLVASAGCSTVPGMPASENSILAMQEIGIDLSTHRSRPIEPAAIARASRIHGMGGSHVFVAERMLAEIGGPFEEDGKAPSLLAGSEEIADPFGGDLATYRRVRDEIREAISELPLPRPTAPIASS